MAKTPGEARQERLAEALRANLKRRKMHGRSVSRPAKGAPRPSLQPRADEKAPPPKDRIR